jgi:outer membrane lipoprotein-sorting protein
VKLFRTLSTTRLIALAVVVLAVAVGGGFAVAATGGSGPTPAPKPLAQAIHDALAGQKPDGITANIGFTNTLFPSGSIVGQAGSALMSSATGRLWVNANGGRLELQSDAGDAQIVWSDKKVTVYDATSNTAYVADLPASKSTDAKDAGQHAVPSVDEITKFLTDLSKDWSVSSADPSNTGGQQSYTVKVSPSHDGGLLGSAQLAFDALRGVPLKVAVYAQGSSSPVLALEATNVSYGAVPDSAVQVAPPAGAKIVDLSSQAQGAGSGSGKDHSTPPVTGLDAVTNAAPFTVVAPDKLVGLPRQDVRLVGGKTVIAVYGQGLGAIVLVERAPDTAAKQASPLDQLPAVTIDGATGHELATQLGTIVTWDRAGVSYVLAGSLPSAAAEAAARSLK